MKLSTLSQPVRRALDLGALGLLVVVAAGIAQEPVVEGAPVATEQSTTLWQLIKVGGWCMWPLGAFSVAAVALVVRNFLMLQDKKLLRPDLVPHMAQEMARRHVAAVRQTCEEHRCLLTAVVGAGLERVTGEHVSPESMTAAMEEASTEQVTMFMTPISYLSIIGGVAPMVGLLGTVSGMIKAFQNIAAGGMGKPEVLAGNIGEALITTATGLIIAIPAMIFYFYFKHSFMRTMAKLGRISGHLMDAFRAGAVPSASFLQAELDQ